MDNPLLIYHNQLDGDGTPWARLELVDGAWPKMRIRERYIATSGQPGYQSFAEMATVGAGPIPRTEDQCYFVGTSPIALPGTPGVRGNFYPITPFKLPMGRSDTGIHFDPVDSPEGSAGCIVLRNKAAWGLFEQRMTAYQSGGVEQIPLLVFYSD